MSGIKSGVSGFVLLIPAIFMAVILYFIRRPAELWWGIAWEVAALIFVIGILLVSMGSMKLGKYYKNILPSVAGILGLVGAIIGLVGVITGFIGVFVLVAFLTDITNIMVPVAFVLEGVFFILFGVALIVLRDKIGLVGLSIGVGIMAIIAGAILCPEILVGILGIVGMIVLIPTAICAAYLLTKAKGIPEEEVKEAKKLVVRPAEVKAKRMKPEEVEAEVYKYVKRSPGGIDVAECAEELGISEEEVQKAINALVRKGKLEIG